MKGVPRWVRLETSEGTFMVPEGVEYKGVENSRPECAGADLVALMKTWELDEQQTAALFQVAIDTVYRFIDQPNLELPRLMAKKLRWLRKQNVRAVKQLVFRDGIHNPTRENVEDQLAREWAKRVRV